MRFLSKYLKFSFVTASFIWTTDLIRKGRKGNELSPNLTPQTQTQRRENPAAIQSKPWNPEQTFHALQEKATNIAMLYTGIITGSFMREFLKNSYWGLGLVSGLWSMNALSLSFRKFPIQLLYFFRYGAAKKEFDYQNPQNENEVVLCLSAQEDCNGALWFTTEIKNILLKLGDHYSLQAREISSTDEISELIKSISEQDKKIKKIILFAHGSPVNITLDGKNIRSGEITSDALGKIRRMFQKIPPDCEILLLSCAVGKYIDYERFSQINIAEAIARATGARVIAPIESFYFSQPKLNQISPLDVDLDPDYAQLLGGPIKLLFNFPEKRRVYVYDQNALLKLDNQRNSFMRREPNEEWLEVRRRPDGHTYIDRVYLPAP